MDDTLLAKPKMVKVWGLKVGELVIRIKTLRLMDGIPVAVYDAYELHKLFPKLLKIEESSPTLYKERTVYPENGTAVELTYF